MFLSSKSSYVKGVLSGVLGAMLVAVILTFSRGAWLALLFMSLYIIIRSRGFRKMIPVLIVSVILICASGVYGLILLRINTTSGYDPAVAGRMVLWSSALNIIKDNLLTGVGMNNFRIVKYSYGTPLMFYPGKIMSAHNVYLEIFADFGILGIIAFLWIFCSLLTHLDRTIRTTHDPTVKAIVLGLSAAMIGYLIHGLVDCSIANQTATFGLGLLMAMSVAITRAKPGIS
jgi:O-antigen ligase